VAGAVNLTEGASPAKFNLSIGWWLAGGCVLISKPPAELEKDGVEQLLLAGVHVMVSMISLR
jgi:hypothetical protein